MDITDASGYPGSAEQVFSPENEQQVVEILKRASAENVPITVMGALTGVTGGGTPNGGWGLSLAKLRVINIEQTPTQTDIKLNFACSLQYEFAAR